MLCPEVWDFEAPQHRIEYHDRLLEQQPSSLDNHNNRPTDTIKSHYFNHSVSVVLPNTSSIPEGFNENILEDSDYYRVNGLRVADLVNKEFIESFVKKGELSLLTIEKKIDLDNLAAVTPTGHLLLSLARESYQKLGIEGRATYFERNNHSRYVVTIDLKDEILTPGKRNYERIRNGLDEVLDLRFDVVASWDPPEETTCPSSIAAWFHNRGYSVSTCHQRAIRRAEYSLDIPLLDGEGCDRNKFFEWLGVFSVAGDLTNQGKDAAYVSSYACPTPKVQIGQVQYLQFAGFFTRRRVQRIYKIIEEFAAAKKDTLPWCSVDVQGFADSPVSWGLKEHNFYTDGDNSYTILLRPSDGAYIMRKSLSSNNKPKITQ